MGKINIAKICITFSFLYAFLQNYILAHSTPKLENDLKIISREEWNADSPSDNMDNLKLPVKMVVIAHTATQFCTNQADCSKTVKLIQNNHKTVRNFSDISYNFLIGGDGNAYEGRGWNKIGAHSKNYNNITIGIAFIGNFMENQPNELQLNAAKLLLKKGVELNKLTSDYKLYGHRQLRPTLSPGDNLYTIIKTWEHWSETI